MLLLYFFLGAKHLLYPLVVFFFLAAHRTACRKVMKFGTQIDDSLNISYSKFGGSISNSLVSPTGQICTHVSANNFWTVRSRSKIRAKNGLEAISSQHFSGFRPNLVRVISSMTWENMSSFGTASATGQNLNIFVYNFWSVWPKIIRIRSR